MAGGIQSAAHRGDVRFYAGCGLIVRGQHRFDFMVGVCGEDFLIAVRWQAFTPSGFYNLHVQTVTLAHVDPTVAEHTVACSEDFVTRRQRVGQCSFPAASAGGGEDENLRALAFEHFAHTFAGRVQDLTKQRRAVIDSWHIASLAQALWDVGWTGNKDGVLKAHGKSPSSVAITIASTFPAENFFEK